MSSYTSHLTLPPAPGSVSWPMGTKSWLCRKSTPVSALPKPGRRGWDKAKSKFFGGSGEDPPQEAADHAYAHGDFDEASADEAHNRAPPGTEGFLA